MACRGFPSPRYEFQSRIGNLKWQYSGGRTINFVCTTDRGEWVAKLGIKVLSFSKKAGTLEIVDESFPEPIQDELVVSALALMIIGR